MKNSTVYPFAKTFFVVAICAVPISAVIFGSLIAGFAFFVLFVGAGLVWRANEPPVLPFAIAFQWMFIVSGYLYTKAGGDMGEYALIGNVDLAVLLSLIGLLCIALGMRLGLMLVRRRPQEQEEFVIDITTLFWVTVITYSVSWMVQISPMEIFFNGAQVLYSVLSFREVLLCLLWFVILQRREGYRYGWIAFVIALLPRFISRQSTFKELIFMMLVVALVEFRPWIKTGAQRAWNRRIFSALAVVSVMLVLAGVIWEGAIKPVWRTIEFEGTPLQTLDAFAHVATATTSEMDEEKSIQAFVNRVSSITQFALVLDRVPSVVPFENGMLTKRAVVHVLFPRILFPSKAELGSDSALAEEYAGISVGEDTSVGIGYMAEFYVDWGIDGMFPFLFGLGLLLGVIYQLIFLLAPSRTVANALVIVPFIGNFITFEATLPKLLGGFIMSTAILLILSRAIPYMVRVKRGLILTQRSQINDVESTGSSATR